VLLLTITTLKQTVYRLQKSRYAYHGIELEIDGSHCYDAQWHYILT